MIPSVVILSKEQNSYYDYLRLRLEKCGKTWLVIIKGFPKPLLVILLFIEHSEK